MSSVLVCAAPFQGHVAPALAAAEGLVQRGHRTRLLTGSRFRDQVERAGVEWVPLPAEVDFDETAMDEWFPQRRELRGLAQAKFDLEHGFLRPMTAQASAIDRLIAAEPTDAVLAETMFFGVIPLALNTGPRPRVVALGCNPLNLPAVGVPPVGTGWAPTTGVAGRVRNAAARLAIERLVFGSLQSAAATAAAGAGARLPGFVMDWLSWVDEIVQLTVPGFEYPREGTVPVRFAGPLSRSGDGDHPLPDWWSGLDPDRPTVLVTQGSAVPDPHNLILPVVEATEGMALNLVISAPDSMDLGRLPSYARRSPFLPYDAVFPRLSAFVTNGGYGGVGFAIRHGVPVLSVGASEDKGEVAARVRWSGLGIGIRRNQIPRARAERALHRLLSQQAYRRSAARLQRQAAEAPGIESVVAAVSDRRGAPSRWS